ncbi:MAG: hypothetical protein OWS74_07720 [Firmicutes bacterium]|nr:hypothetical protein [Bacillota bacterium]
MSFLAWSISLFLGNAQKSATPQQLSAAFNRHSFGYTSYYEDEGHPGPNFLLQHASALHLNSEQKLALTVNSKMMRYTVQKALTALQQVDQHYRQNSLQHPVNEEQILHDIQNAGKTTAVIAQAKIPYAIESDALLSPAQQSAAQSLLPADTVPMSAHPHSTPVSLKTMTSAQRHQAMAYFETHSLGYGPNFIKEGHPGPRWILMHKKLLQLSSAQIQAIKPLAYAMEMQAVELEPGLQADYAVYAYDAAHNAPLTTIVQDIHAVEQQTIKMGSVMLPTHLQAESLLTSSQMQKVDAYYNVPYVSGVPVSIK